MTTKKTAAQMTTQCTAKAAYRIRREAVAALVRRLEEHLQELDRQHAEYPGHWGYPGDLGRIEVCLHEAIGD
jgi:hypothetical protein